MTDESKRRRTASSETRPDKDPLLSFNVKPNVFDKLRQMQADDPAAPSWAYICRRALVAGMAALGYPVDGGDGTTDSNGGN